MELSPKEIGLLVVGLLAVQNIENEEAVEALLYRLEKEMSVLIEKDTK